MTMYVRTLVPMTLTISSQTDEDDVLLDGNNPIAVLPLWAAQREEFQVLWAEERVQVATDPDFNNKTALLRKIASDVWLVTSSLSA